MRIAIIGGGLAGCAAAYVLKQAGLEPVIYEAGAALACGASGNDLGLYNPRISAEYTPEAEYFAVAFAAALETFSHFEDVDWRPCGALHLVNDEKKAKRYPKTVKNWGWAQDDLRMVSAVEGSALAGVELEYEALYIRRSGSVSPRKLCAAYVQGVEVHLNTHVERLDEIKADAYILAGGPLTKDLFDLPTKTVRGQVTQVKGSAQSLKLACNICYGGYFSAAVGGVHMLGSSFQPWLTHRDILPQDDQDNIAKLADHVPALSQGLEVVDHRASLRTTSPDHFPIMGQAGEGLYVSTAHGSHGILSSLIAAHEIAAMITGKGGRLSQQVLARVSPQRFLGAE